VASCCGDVPQPVTKITTSAIPSRCNQREKSRITAAIFVSVWILTLSKTIQSNPLFNPSCVRTVCSCWLPQLSIDVACNLLQQTFMGMSWLMEDGEGDSKQSVLPLSTVWMARMNWERSECYSMARHDISMNGGDPCR
jgi:hypothetical protein